MFPSTRTAPVVQAQSPNIQVDSTIGAVDCGHAYGNNTLALYCDTGLALTNTLGSNTIVIGDTDTAVMGDSVINIGNSNLLGGSSGASSLYIGVNAGYNSTLTTNNIAIGNSVMHTTGTLLTQNNIGIGQYALREVGGATPSAFQTAIGYYAGYQSTLTGESNLLIGSNTGYGGALQSYNTVVGIDALKNGSVSSSNVILGVSSCNNADLGSHNVAIGNSVLRDVVSSSTDYCVAMGYHAGYQASAIGDQTILIGREVGEASNLTGDNIFIGWQAGMSSTVSSGANTIMGSFAGKGSTFVSSNVGLGARALSSTSPFVCTVGSDVVAIGNRAGESAFVNKTINSGAILLGARSTRGAGNTVVAANEVLFGYDCNASNVAGRLRFQNREAPATTATAGAQTLPANPDCFIPLVINNVLYKMPAYLP